MNENLKKKINELPPDKQGKIILLTPIPEDSFLNVATGFNDGWMLTIVLERKDIEVIGLFKDWAYGKIALEKFSEVFGATKVQ